MQENKKIEEYFILGDSGEGKKNLKEKLNGFLGGRYFVSVIIVLIAIIAFSLGRTSGLQDKREPVRVLNSFQTINNPPSPPYIKGTEGNTSADSISAVSNIQQTASAAASVNQVESVVASKNGTRYHYPWCAGAKQISQKNLITFDSIESARAAGYTPATNCKGLK